MYFISSSVEYQEINISSTSFFPNLIKFKYQEHAGNDRLGFVCEEDFADKKKPVQREEAITKLQGEFATNMVIQAFSDVMHQEIDVLTVHGVRRFLIKNTHFVNEKNSIVQKVFHLYRTYYRI